MSGETYYPSEENLGQNCMYWDGGEDGLQNCAYPKLELIGRRSCEGVIGDVCLFISKGRRPSSLTKEQIAELKLRVPEYADKSYIPPGDIT